MKLMVQRPNPKKKPKKQNIKLFYVQRTNGYASHMMDVRIQTRTVEA